MPASRQGKIVSLLKKQKTNIDQRCEKKMLLSFSILFINCMFFKNVHIKNKNMESYMCRSICAQVFLVSSLIIESQ